MVVVAMSSDVTRVAEATQTPDTGTWGNDGGGGGVADEADVVYQGTSSQSRKVSTSRIGRNYTHGSGIDMTATATSHYIAKINATNSAALLARTSPAMGMKIGSSSAAYHNYWLFGNDNYPPVGGFRIVAIDPTVTGYSSEAGDTGTPSDTAVLYWSLLADFSAGSKVENLIFDAIDVGTGLNLVSGTGADPQGTYDDFVLHDEGTSANRWGFVTSDLPAIFVIGQLTIGQTSAGTSTVTEFSDTGNTLIWRNGLVSTGFNRLLIDLATSLTDITSDGCSFDSQGQVDNDGDRGYTTTEDSRPIYEVTGTTGTSVFTGCAFTNWQSFLLTSASDILTTKFVNCGTISTEGGSLAGCTIESHLAATGDTTAVLWNSTANPSGSLDDLTMTAGVVAAHAIEFTATGPLTVDITDSDFSGYVDTVDNAATIFDIKRTSGTVTINAVGCTGITVNSYATAGATVNIVLDPVTVQVTTQEADGTAVGTANVFLEVTSTASGYPYLGAITVSDDEAGGTKCFVTHTAHSLTTNDQVNIQGAGLSTSDKGVFTVTVTDANSYNYETGEVVSLSAVAGTCTFVLLFGTSHASTGVLAMSKVFTDGQAVAGNARKSSAAPYWKSAGLIGTINVPGGLLLTALMLPDE